MAELVAIVKVENMPLYREMAEFVVTVATTDDAAIPEPIRARAINLGMRLKEMIDHLNERRGSNGE